MKFVFCGFGITFRRFGELFRNLGFAFGNNDRMFRDYKKGFSVSKNLFRNMISHLELLAQGFDI